MRKSGIEVVGDLPWGSHLCLFYEARADLLGVVASYFKTGLEGNELCVWVVSPDISQKDALAALAPAVPDLETHLRAHRLEVVPHSQVYFTGKTLDPEHVLHWWQNRLDEVSQRGFEGLRVFGDTAWLERKDWDTFAGCEEAVSESMVGKQVLALCAYPLDKCSPSDVFDVVQTHGLSIVKRGRTWRVIGDVAAQRWATQQIREREAYIASILRTISVGICVISLEGTHLLVNDSLCRMTGFSREEMEGQQPPYPYWDPDGLDIIQRAFQDTLAGANLGQSLELPFRRKDGQKFIAQVDISEFTDAQGQRIAFSASVQDITRRKRDEEELLRHSAELASLLEVSRAVTESLDLDQVLEDVISNAQRVIPLSEQAIISLYDEKKGHLVTRRRLIPGQKSHETTPIAIRPGEGITGRTFSTGEARLYATSQEITEARANLRAENLEQFLKTTRGRMPTSAIAVPLKSADRTLGCMLFHSFGQRAFTPHDLELAQAFAGHAAIAISNASLYDDVRRRSKDLASLVEASRIVTSSLDLDKVLGNIMDNLKSVIPAADVQAIALYDETDGLLKTRFASAMRPGEASLLGMRPGEGITGRTFQSGEARLYISPQQVAEIQASLAPENAAAFLKMTGNRKPSSSIGVPLKLGDRVIGCMMLHTFDQRVFTSHDLEMAQGFAGHAAVAINNAVLNNELASLLEASRAITGSLDLDQVLSRLMDNMRRVIPTAQTMAIAIYDKAEGLLKTRLASGYEPGAVSMLAIRPGESISGKTFQTGQANLYATSQDVVQAQASLSPENRALFVKATQGKWPDSAITVPVQSSDTTLGVITLLGFGRRAFTPHDLDLAQAFANAAAVAISNSTLHAEMASLLEASHAISSSLDMEQVMSAVTDSLRHVITGVEAQSIALYDEKDGVLKTRFAFGYVPEATPIATIPGEGMTGKAFQTGEAMRYATSQEVAEAQAQANLSPGNLTLFLKATEGKRPTSSMALPLKSGDRTLGCMLLHAFGQRAFTHHELGLAQAFANIVAVSIANATLHEEMSQRALTDGLTGLYNRGHFYERLKEETARHSRDRRPLCVAMLDVNSLKAYNDTHGHIAGDRALQVIARALKAAVRQSDIVFRYGGDEFSIILVNTSGDVARGAVDRAKAHVAKELASSGVESKTYLGLSAGVAVYGQDGPAETDLVEAADKALYRSKAIGGATVLYGRGMESGQE